MFELYIQKFASTYLFGVMTLMLPQRSAATVKLKEMRSKMNMTNIITFDAVVVCLLAKPGMKMIGQIPLPSSYESYN